MHLQCSRSAFLFYLFLLLLPFLIIKSSMYSVKNKKFLLAHSSSFESVFWYSFIAVLCPLHIVSWCSSLVPSFIVVFSLSLHCTHPFLSPKPLHLCPSPPFQSLRSLVQAFLPSLVYCSPPKSPLNLYQAPYRAHILWLHSHFSHTQSSLHIISYV